jgi:hypothetical protein
MRLAFVSPRTALVAAVAALALLIMPLLAASASARALTADDKQLLKQYRLSLDTTERCVAAYRDAITEPGPKQELERVKTRQSEKTLAQIIKSWDADYPATAAALKKRNCQPRDFVLSTSVMAYARLVDQARQQGKVTQGFDFVTPENLTTFDKNKDRFAALTAELQQLVVPPAAANRRQQR